MHTRYLGSGTAILTIRGRISDIYLLTNNKAINARQRFAAVMPRDGIIELSYDNARGGVRTAAGMGAGGGAAVAWQVQGNGPRTQTS